MDISRVAFSLRCRDPDPGVKLPSNYERKKEHLQKGSFTFLNFFPQEPNATLSAVKIIKNYTKIKEDLHSFVENVASYIMNR
jgi:hypothetical protein